MSLPPIHPYGCSSDRFGMEAERLPSSVGLPRIANTLGATGADSSGRLEKKLVSAL
jgi:hypothetical protein